MNRRHNVTPRNSYMPAHYNADRHQSRTSEEGLGSAAPESAGAQGTANGSISMRVLFVSAEIFPLAKTGGLGDVCAALPPMLVAGGAEVQLMMPGYSMALEQAVDKRVVAQLPSFLGAPPCRIVSALTPDTHLPIFLLDCPELYRRDGGPYQDRSGFDWPDNALRFALLCRVAADLAMGGILPGWRADVVHCNDGMLDPHTAAAIERIPGVPQLGTRAGNWLTRDQAKELLNAPDSNTLTGKRDRAILALLLGCGLRRAELLRLNVEDLEQREARWVIPDLVGKGNRQRLVTIPAGVKARIDLWTKAAGITEGRLFRPVNKGGVMVGEEIRDEKAIWTLVMRYAKETELGKLAPHDLRRTCAKLCRKAGGDLEQIQILLGHASIQTTERYLGTEQALDHAVNDGIGLDLG